MGLRAGAPIKLSGAIGGIVTNAAGDAQMGASVVLYDRLERISARVFTDERGEFRFPGLFPEIYSIRVTLSNFVPALKRDILVQPGARAVLNVNLNTLFSSIQIAYPPADKGTFMSDDWKWMLRTAASTRPVLRFLPDPIAKTPDPATHGPVFSDTRGLLELSAGDGSPVTGIGNQADLGTAFALATSLYGNHQLQVSGNLGYGSQTGVPAAAIRTAYTVTDGPEISVTMRQLFMPGRGGLAGPDAALPMLRSVSASVDQRSELSDEATLQYGFTMDSVSFGDRVSYFSPYARLVYSLGNIGELAVGYSSGNARPDLSSRFGQDSELQRDLSSVGLFPRISVRDGRIQVQRGNEYEVSFSRKIGSRRVDVSAYRETVNNAALSLALPSGTYPVAGGDVLPDLFTGNAIFNAGNYTTTGYTGALTQNVGQNLSATIMWGTLPGLTTGHEELVSSSPDELRAMIRASRRQALTAEVTATAPWTGTHVIASYQWLGPGDAAWMTMGNLYSMQSLRPVPGLNVYVRQPIPVLSMLPWRIEATADLRNILAEGYLPLTAPNGQSALLVENPRSFRGGLSFIF
jgi:hypothetical protein